MHRFEPTQAWVQKMNTLVYGSEFTKFEMMGMGIIISEKQQRGEFSDDPTENDEIATRLVANLTLGNLDDPQLKGIINDYYASRSKSAMLSRFAGVGGMTYTDTWKQQFESAETYFELQHPARRRWKRSMVQR
jgi:hypothetical protein